MSMYVLQVMTGKETDIRDALLDDGIPAYAPVENRQIHFKGRWRQKHYLLFPSYVFVVTRDVASAYYKIRRYPDVLRWLELHSSGATALMPQEEELIRQMCGTSGTDVMESVVEKDGNALLPVSGLLRWFYDRRKTILYDLHARRAIVGNPLSLMPNRILKLSITLEQ